MRQPITTTPDQHKVTLHEALASLPDPEITQFAEVFRHGSLRVEIYAPIEVDKQQPHVFDEVYVVARGHGEFLNDGVRQTIRTGDFLFVPAFVEHRFENFSDDFVVWVFFYGPEGGEAESKDEG